MVEVGRSSCPTPVAQAGLVAKDMFIQLLRISKINECNLYQLYKEGTNTEK